MSVLWVDSDDNDPVFDAAELSHDAPDLSECDLCGKLARLQVVHSSEDRVGYQEDLWICEGCL